MSERDLTDLIKQMREDINQSNEEIRKEIEDIKADVRDLREEPEKEQKNVEEREAERYETNEDDQSITKTPEQIGNTSPSTGEAIAEEPGVPSESDEEEFAVDIDPEAATLLQAVIENDRTSVSAISSMTGKSSRVVREDLNKLASEGFVDFES